MSTWADDSMFYFGQEIPVDEQCRLRFGDTFVYAGVSWYFRPMCTGAN